MKENIHFGEKRVAFGDPLGPVIILGLNHGFKISSEKGEKGRFFLSISEFFNSEVVLLSVQNWYFTIKTLSQ